MRFRAALDHLESQRRTIFLFERRINPKSAVLAQSMLRRQAPVISFPALDIHDPAFSRGSSPLLCKSL